MLRIIFLVILLLITPFAIANTPQITISGITGSSLKNVEARLNLALEQYSGDDETFYADAPSHIKKALAPYGFFKVEVQTIRHNNSVHFKINPGQPITIQSIDLQILGPGKDEAAIQIIAKKYRLLEAKILHTEEYEKTKDVLFEAAAKLGYLKAFLEKKAIKIDLSKNTAHVILHFNTGERYYFGHILFNENPFAAEFLKRFMTFKEGEPFSSEKLLEFQNNLSNSHYFNKVIVNPLFEQTDKNDIPTQVELTVPKSQQYKIGLGYGTFTGPRLTAGFDWRRIGDAGQHLSTELKLSSVLSGLSAKYFIPGEHPLTDQYMLGLNVQHFVPENGDSFSETLSFGLLKSLEKWRHSITINFLNDRYEENNLPLRTSHLLYPSYTISRISADDLLHPKRGSSMSLTVQGASKTFASTTSFFQTEWKGKYIFSPTDNSKIILANHFGYTVVEELNQLPLTMNFFAGGLNSVRGYSYDSLGPGRYLRTGSLEFQHKIAGDWSAAVFYDVGTASNHFNDPLKKGDGFGVIYSSPIGPIKVYVARAESDETKPLSLEFSIGPEF